MPQPVAHRPTVRATSTACALLILASLAGCAAMRRDEAIKTERTLAAAGFQMKFAETPEQTAQLQSFAPQRTLVPRQMDGFTRFVYADAEYCKCIYVGTELAYRRFERLALIQQLSQERLEAAQAREAAAMNWGAWGPWGPFW